MKLIHRDHLSLSPHYQPSATSEDRIWAMIDRFMSRAHYISSIISGTSYSTESIDSSNGYSSYSGCGGGHGSVYASIASSLLSAATTLMYTQK